MEIIRVWVLLSTSSTHTETRVSPPTSPLSKITALMKCDQSRKKIQCGMVASLEDHNLFSAQQNPFYPCSLISHGLCSLQKPRQWQTVPFHHSSTFAFGHSALNRKVFVLALLDHRHGPWWTLQPIHAPQLFSPRKQPPKQTGCSVWTFSEVAISSTKCLCIPKASDCPCILGTQCWGFALLSGRFGDVYLMVSVNKLISILFMVFFFFLSFC